jgi:Putative transposase/Transposase zinc-binding domain
MGPSAAIAVYRRRTPERTALYRCVQEHLETFRGRAEDSGAGLPAVVERELAGFLECGILAFGFARVHCEGCGYDRLVGFSCKGRGFCPSCCGRRMADTAAYLVDAVLPAVPIRQWVLSLPKPLRGLCAYDAELCRRVLGYFMDAVFARLRRLAKHELGLRRLKAAQPGAVTAVQRFGSAAELNLHFHSLVTDGVYVDGQEGAPRFVALPEPTAAEVQAVAWSVCERTVAHLRKLGRWLDEATVVGGDAEPDSGEALLQRCVEASLAGELVFARGRRPMRLYGSAARQDLPAGAKAGYGFDVHAGVRVPASERRRLEQLCRYILRPPLSNERLRRLDDDRFAVRLKRPWADGTTELVFDGPELVARLAALVPPPRVHTLRYHGVFAPHAKRRAEVVPTQAQVSGCAGHVAIQPAAATPHATRRRLDWAKLLARVWAIDVLACPKCDGPMQRFAFVTAPTAIAAILRSVGLPTAPPVRTPARRQEQPELDFESSATDISHWS